MNATLIVPLDTELQSVTWMLGFLLAQGFAIHEVRVLYRSASGMEAAIETLQSEFSKTYPSVRYCAEAVQGEEGAISDIAIEQEAQAFLRSVYRAILRAKDEQRAVHLGMIDGNSLIAMYALAAAQLLFDENDHAWHILSRVSPPGTERRAHAIPPERFRAAAVPVVRWSDAATVRVLLAGVDDPWEALRRQQEFIFQETTRRRREFWEHHLTPALREVAELLVREGLDNAEIARRLHKSEHTVANQLTRVYRAFDEWRGTSAGKASAMRAAFIAEFASLFSHER